MKRRVMCGLHPDVRYRFIENDGGPINQHFLFDVQTKSSAHIQLLGSSSTTRSNVYIYCHVCSSLWSDEISKNCNCQSNCHER